MLWLNAKDISKCVNEKSLIDSIKHGFQSLDTDSTEPKRIKADLSSVHHAPKDAHAMILVPGAVPGIPAYTVKVHAKYPNNPSVGVPAIQGVIQLLIQKRVNYLPSSTRRWLRVTEQRRLGLLLWML
ncbi:hypothetical protein AAC03nite_35910 [Alicyclobacillus acidoterrestris]|nr:hypothetical protein AAC03nite_35910 [Alicyclobacillus acidoterrestris]